MEDRRALLEKKIRALELRIDSWQVHADLTLIVADDVLELVRQSVKEAFDLHDRNSAIRALRLGGDIYLARYRAMRRPECESQFLTACAHFQTLAIIDAGSVPSSVLTFLGDPIDFDRDVEQFAVRALEVFDPQAPSVAALKYVLAALNEWTSLTRDDEPCRGRILTTLGGLRLIAFEADGDETYLDQSASASAEALQLDVTDVERATAFSNQSYVYRTKFAMHNQIQDLERALDAACSAVGAAPQGDMLDTFRKNVVALSRANGSFIIEGPRLINGTLGVIRNGDRTVRPRIAGPWRQYEYPERDRASNVTVLRQVIGALTGSGPLDVVDRLRDDFHPSLLSELDYWWFMAEVNRTDDNGLADLATMIFLYTLPENVAMRATKSGVVLVQPIPRSYGDYRKLAQAEQIERGGRSLQNLGGEQDIAFQRVDALLTTMLRRIRDSRDARRVLTAVEQAVANALLLLIDHPATRASAMQFRMDWSQRKEQPWPNASAPTGAGGDWVREHLAAWCDEVAAIANSTELQALTTLAHAAADAVSRRLAQPFNSFEGIRQLAMGPCGRCAMHFWSEYIAVFDTTLFTQGHLPPGAAYVPPLFNIDACPFCGERAPCVAPTVFCSIERRQLIFFIPLYGQDFDSVADACLPLLRALLNAYRLELSGDQKAQLDSAVEIFTHTREDFLHAIQTGDTLDEDHVHNIVMPEVGDVTVVDLSKSFYRVIDRDERSTAYLPSAEFLEEFNAQFEALRQEQEGDG